MEMQNKNHSFFEGVASIIEQSRLHIERSVNTAMCLTYYEVGQQIVEQEQSGTTRAVYGARILDELSAYLTIHYGKGWSVSNLKNARRFYQIYSPVIRQSLIAESEKQLVTLGDPRKGLGNSSK